MDVGEQVFVSRVNARSAPSRIDIRTGPSITQHVKEFSTVPDPPLTEGRTPEALVADPLVPPRARAWVAALTAGVLGAVISGVAGEASFRSVPTETEGANVNGENKEIVTVLSSYRSDVKRGILTYGLQGAILGVSLGLAGAVSRRSARAVAFAMLAGLIAGGAASAGLSAVVFPAFFRNFDPISGDLSLSLITHLAVFSVVGATSGLAFGIGLGGGPGRAARAALGGLVGAVVGSITYECIGAFAFPQARTDLPVAAEMLARLLAQALTGLAVSIGVVVASTSVRLRGTNSPP
jgi:hypothetical protein